MATIELIPDPGDQFVWDNMRRLRDLWAPTVDIYGAVDPLELIPDPGNDFVWENMRRIFQWTELIRSQIDADTKKLELIPDLDDQVVWENFRRINDWTPL